MDKIDEILRDNKPIETAWGDPTILSPYDSYYTFKHHPETCATLFGMHTIEDIDNHVKSLFKEEFWPKHLTSIGY